jgi:hypothetical protein
MRVRVKATGRATYPDCSMVCGPIDYDADDPERTTITHPATTTQSRLTPEARAHAGITEGLIRLAVGLEDRVDLQADLARALAAARTA